ncbi:hypothetical protein HW555_012787 [Spodoptera exigua]|uniref:Uncharacterized protein n=1 Tax=Spodoptera exigua TaxID=7107 RepID=A0A835L0E3_SPOEX|nr:hypothetical protein HW555_012787 [Spodoptera exigua]
MDNPEALSSLTCFIENTQLRAVPRYSVPCAVRALSVGLPDINLAMEKFGFTYLWNRGLRISVRLSSLSNNLPMGFHQSLKAQMLTADPVSTKKVKLRLFNGVLRKHVVHISSWNLKYRRFGGFRIDWLLRRGGCGGFRTS